MGASFCQDRPNPTMAWPILPGHIWVLPEEQQDLLGVEEEGPAGEAAEKQHQQAPLQDDPHVLLVGATICLGAHGQNKPISTEMAPPLSPAKVFNYAS